MSCMALLRDFTSLQDIFDPLSGSQMPSTLAPGLRQFVESCATVLVGVPTLALNRHESVIRYLLQLCQYTSTLV